MTFYALHMPNREPERISLLRAACKKLGVSFRPLTPFTVDFSKTAPVKKGDIVYRVSRGLLLHPFEKFFLQPGAVTFYKNPAAVPNDPFILSKEGLPCPQTIFCTTRKRSVIMKYVKALGGFPIVLKALGGTRGLGVMKVDSYSALFGIVDYLLEHQKLLTLQQFIPQNTSARVIVLGNKVIGSMEYRAKNHDFRTNEAHRPDVFPKKFTKDLEQLAVRATHAMGLEFSGVDILINKKERYITEVNFPCNFVRAQTVLGKDIALQMVAYLRDKSAVRGKAL